MASLFYPHANVDGYVNEARSRFIEECNYVHEAHYQEVFGRIYADHPVLFVPAVLPEYCAHRVLTTEFAFGDSFEDFLATNPSQDRRNAVGEALFEFYIGSLFRHNIYNCDPHPGNYLFCDNGRVAMLDHGCTRQFEPAFVASLAFLTKAVHRDEEALIRKALLRLKIVRPNKKYDYAVIRGFLRSFYGPMLRDEVSRVDLSSAMEMKEIFKKKRQLLKFALPGEFTFLFRIRFGLMSVLSRLGTEANWFRLEKRYVDDFEARHPVLLA
jgi:predicted unusual protein kinase regulating ubiquinone biosynthesis (AarF/ABC1/UbiB family)